MIRRIFVFFAVGLAAASVFPVYAQDLDPTVEVSREYEGKLIEVHKPALTMAVPDSVLMFALDFDYSVFESPYKGSYEFNPYSVSMTPSGTAYRPGKFYLRAGAGYTLHPVADMVWSPFFRNRVFSMDVHASSRSYFGKYKAVGGFSESDWKGSDAMTDAGVNMNFDWNSASLGMEVGYENLYRHDHLDGGAYNALEAAFRISSKSPWPDHFLYDAVIGYRYGYDNLAGGVREQNLKCDIVLGPVWKTRHKFLFDVDVELAMYSGDVSAMVGEVSLSPHYVFTRNALKVDAGILLSMMLRPDGPVSHYSSREQYVYPDVRVELAVIPDAMKMYAALGGGNRIETYSSILKRNHHFNYKFGRGVHEVLDITVESFSGKLGFEGRIGNIFSYDLKGGYSDMRNAPLDAFVPFVSGDALTLLPSLAYSSYRQASAEFGWRLDAASIRFDGTMSYAHVWDMPDMGGFFAPASFSGDVSCVYNWRKRVYVGLDCSFALARQASFSISSTEFAVSEIPAYADLGVYAEYVALRKLSFWLRGGNLLDQTVCRNVFYAEKGLNFTAGICLKL